MLSLLIIADSEPAHLPHQNPRTACLDDDDSDDEGVPPTQPQAMCATNDDNDSGSLRRYGPDSLDDDDDDGDCDRGKHQPRGPKQLSGQIL